MSYSEVYGDIFQRYSNNTKSLYKFLLELNNEEYVRFPEDFEITQNIEEELSLGYCGYSLRKIHKLFEDIAFMGVFDFYRVTEVDFLYEELKKAIEEGVPRRIIKGSVFSTIERNFGTENDIKILKLYIEFEISPNLCDKQRGGNLLHALCNLTIIGTFDNACIKYLVEQGANPSTLDKYGNTPLMMIANLYKIHRYSIADKNFDNICKDTIQYLLGVTDITIKNREGKSVLDFLLG